MENASSVKNFKIVLWKYNKEVGKSIFQQVCKGLIIKFLQQELFGWRRKYTLVLTNCYRKVFRFGYESIPRKNTSSKTQKTTV
jgi:hypothetical protein